VAKAGRGRPLVPVSGSAQPTEGFGGWGGGNGKRTFHMVASIVMDESSGLALAPTAARHRLATLFVDIAGSTSLLVHHPPEVVLGVVQCFLGLVTETALAHTGHVKDYEGDGALLYFESPLDAARAALAIREALAAGRCDAGCADGPGVRARLSLTIGDLVVGVVGTPGRQGLALVGPSVNVGSRLLKHVAPGGIIASGAFVDAVRAEAPALADEFQLLDLAFEVPGADGLVVATWVARTLS
jgi:class 3 adenylate cyclase